MHKIKIEIDPSLNGLNNSASKKILKHIFNREGVENSNVSIIFGDKDLLQKLKKEFFKIDIPTDVIAFRLNEYENIDIEGEIYICLPVAQENAKYFRETYEREISRLIIHGGLHLIGYDDRTKEEQNKMHDLENKYLKELEI